jgi:hypothetical protein
MGARDWMLVYAEREVQPVLASAPVLDREAKVHRRADLAGPERPPALDHGNCGQDALGRVGGRAPVIEPPADLYRGLPALRARQCASKSATCRTSGRQP